MSTENELSYLAATVAAIQRRIAELAAASGAVNFVELNDVPGNYVGAGGLYAKVKAAEDGLEFAAGGALALDDLTDVAITTPAVGDVLRHDGSNWVDYALNQAAVAGLTTASGPTFDHVHLTSGQVGFPAAQVPSADANTLDDYEEGTWTPTLTFGGASVGMTYGSQVGQYIKVGRTVTVIGQITLTNKGSSTGFAAISGLPFAAAVALSYLSQGSVFTQNTTTYFNFMGQVTSGATVVLYIGTAGAATVVTEASITNTTDLRFTHTYFVD